MTCPLCATDLDRDTLVVVDEGPDLRGFRCPNGHGRFLPSDLYTAWREGHDSGESTGAPIPTADTVGDVKVPKRCPEDGHIMGRYRVGDPASFWLDRCGTCHGVWFDGGEWEATVESGLLDQLPAIVSDAWQRTIDDVSAAQHRTDRLRAQIGPADLARIDDFRAWAWAHPARHVILARLGERPEADG